MPNEAAIGADYFSQRLPPYMNPATVTSVDTPCPLTLAGKIDRKTLLLLAPRERERECLCKSPPSRRDRDMRIAAVMGRTCWVADISRDDNFFALGGNSLLADHRGPSAVARIGRGRFPARDLLAAPTLAGFAQRLAGVLPRTTSAHDVQPMAPCGKRPRHGGTTGILGSRGRRARYQAIFTIPSAAGCCVRARCRRLHRWTDGLGELWWCGTMLCAAYFRRRRRRPPAPCIVLPNRDRQGAGALWRSRLSPTYAPRGLSSESARMSRSPWACRRCGVPDWFWWRRPASTCSGWLCITPWAMADPSASSSRRSRHVCAAKLSPPRPTISRNRRLARKPILPVRPVPRMGATGATCWTGSPILAFAEAPLDFPRSITAKPGNHRFETRLDAATTRGLKALARQHEASLHALMLTLLALEARRRTGRADIIIGTAASIRETAAEAHG
jgi:hypothetical protein